MKHLDNTEIREITGGSGDVVCLPDGTPGPFNPLPEIRF
jgi:hypothetical protein